jgi:hypothetical protein
VRQRCLGTKISVGANFAPCRFKKMPSGANPTIVRYNTRAVNIYNATISLVRLENKNDPALFVVVVNSKVVGMGPDYLKIKQMT